MSLSINIRGGNDFNLSHYLMDTESSTSIADKSRLGSPALLSRNEDGRFANTKGMPQLLSSQERVIALILVVHVQLHDRIKHSTKQFDWSTTWCMKEFLVVLR